MLIDRFHLKSYQCHFIQLFHFFQADLKLKDTSPKEEAMMHPNPKPKLKKVENAANVGDSSNFSSIEHLKHQLEEKDKMIASLRKSIEVIY